MTVRVTREAEPQIELYGAYEGAVVSSGENMLASLTFTPTEDYLILVPKNAVNYPQLEAGSTPSSHIPTSGSSVTRAADTSGLTIPSSVAPWPTPRVIGEELVTNGTFDADSDWTKGTGWTISGGKAVATSVTGAQAIYQAITRVAGSVYKVTVDVSNSSGSYSLNINGAGTGEILTGDGTKTVYVVANTTGSVDLQIQQRTGVALSGEFDNISVKEIDPLVVAIQMKGRMTYADEGGSAQEAFLRWQLDANNNIYWWLNTALGSGTARFWQNNSGTSDQVLGSSADYSPGVNVPFNIAGYHGSTFINGAVDGTALTANTTPTALPDLSGTDLQIGYDFMGNIEEVRIWVGGITDVTSGNLLISEASS